MASAVASHPPKTVIMVMVDGSNCKNNAITRARSIGARFRLGWVFSYFVQNLCKYKKMFE
jgi:hypothetical protein